MAQCVVRHRIRVGVQPGVGQPERQRDGHQPLLGSVMQIALDASSFGVTRRDDAGPGRGDLGELALQLPGAAARCPR